MIGVRKLMIQKSYGAVNDCLCYYDLSPLRGDSARRAHIASPGGKLAARRAD